MDETRRIQRKYFQKMKVFWYEEKEIWRLMLRAKVHYNFKSKKKYFKAWISFKNQQKENRIKQKKAENHHFLKLKRKYFTYIAYFPLNEKLFAIYKYILQNYIIYLFLNFNILSIHLNFLTVNRNYIIYSYMKSKLNEKRVNLSISMLRINALERKRERENRRKAVEFFRRKYYDAAKVYLSFWIKYARKKINRKHQLAKAQNFYELKLKVVYMKKLFNYLNYRQIKRYKANLATELHAKQLKRNTFRILRRFVLYRLTKYEKHRYAIAHHEETLKLKYFRNLLNFTKDEIRLRSIKEQLCFNIKMRCLRQLRLYLIHKKSKKINKLLATSHNEYKIKVNVINSLKTCLMKRNINEYKLGKFIHEKNVQMCKKYFEMWALFKQDRINQRYKTQKATQHLNKKILKKYWQLWTEYILNYSAIQNELEKLLKNWMFRQWKTFVHNRLKYKENMAKAYDMYQNNLIKTALSIIVKAGLNQERSKERVIFNDIEHKLKLASKYFKIWRNKCLINDAFDDEISSQCVLSQSDFTEKFEWHPLCFEEPKVPCYLKNSYD